MTHQIVSQILEYSAFLTGTDTHQLLYPSWVGNRELLSDYQQWHLLFGLLCCAQDRSLTMSNWLSLISIVLQGGSILALEETVGWLVSSQL